MPIFTEKLQQPSDKPRLFVLHLMGSHPEFCQRLTEKPSFDFVNKNISCYLESLKQTDLFIEQVVNQLKAREQSYSLIYFSDHGLSHTDKDSNNVNLRVGSKFKENYQVPFIKISSDDKARVELDVHRSAFNFIYGFADWLKIKEKSLDNGYRFFAEHNDEIKVFDWHHDVDFEQLPADPALM